MGRITYELARLHQAELLEKAAARHVTSCASALPRRWSIRHVRPVGDRRRPLGQRRELTTGHGR
jgi:hypothetical protein